jgi:hypothetical protein
MESLTQITVAPVEIDADKHVVEALFLEHCWNKNLGFKELMLLAYQKGKTDGHIEAYEETLRSLRASRTTPPKAPEYDETSEREASFDFAAWVDDPVREDRAALARQVNSALRASRRER